MGPETGQATRGHRERSESDARLMVCILANPPLTTGVRTLSRVELAGRQLGVDRVRVANLFALPSRAKGEINSLGSGKEGWLEARPGLAHEVDTADAVLLGYGATAPTGAARRHFKTQVAWLRSTVESRDLPLWWVGDGPRHPSRWQRWTSRAFPELEFEDAVHSAIGKNAPITRLDNPAGHHN